MQELILNQWVRWSVHTSTVIHWITVLPATAVQWFSLFHWHPRWATWWMIFFLYAEDLQIWLLTTHFIIERSSGVMRGAVLGKNLTKKIRWDQINFSGSSAYLPLCAFPELFEVSSSLLNIHIVMTLFLNSDVQVKLDISESQTSLKNEKRAAGKNNWIIN